MKNAPRQWPAGQGLNHKAAQHWRSLVSDPQLQGALPAGQQAAPRDPALPIVGQENQLEKLLSRQQAQAA